MGGVVEYHDVQVNQLIEGRRVPRRDVTEDEVYYAVHCVVIGHAKWYHHGVILNS